MLYTIQPHLLLEAGDARRLAQNAGSPVRIGARAIQLCSMQYSPTCSWRPGMRGASPRMQARPCALVREQSNCAPCNTAPPAPGGRGCARPGPPACARSPAAPRWCGAGLGGPAAWCGGACGVLRCSPSGGACGMAWCGAGLGGPAVRTRVVHGGAGVAEVGGMRLLACFCWLALARPGAARSCRVQAEPLEGLLCMAGALAMTPGGCVLCAPWPCWPPGCVPLGCMLCAV